MTKITQDHIYNFGRAAVSPYMSGEQAEDTSAVIQGAARSKNVPIDQTGKQTWQEPDVFMPERSMNTVVFHSKRGGNSIVVNDEGDNGAGHMLITHKSGAVVQIDEHGTVLIKSMGDTFNVTEGLQYQKSAGDHNQNIGGSWNVMVEGGTGNVFINGDLNIECENFKLNARGKATISSGEGIEMKGAKFSIEAHSDNLDLVARNIKLGAAETFSILSAGELSLGTESNLNLKSKGEVRIDASGELKMAGSESKLFGSTVYIDDVVRMAEGGAGDTGVENAVAPSVAEVAEPPGRRPFLDGNEGIVQVYPSAGPLTGREIDGEDS